MTRCCRWLKSTIAAEYDRYEGTAWVMKERLGNEGTAG